MAYISNDHNLRLAACYIWQGFKAEIDKTRKVILSNTVYESVFDKLCDEYSGEISLCSEITEFASLCEELMVAFNNRLPGTERHDLDGVLEYEVLEPFGGWLAQHANQPGVGTLPTPEQGAEELTERMAERLAKAPAGLDLGTKAQLYYAAGAWLKQRGD